MKDEFTITFWSPESGLSHNWIITYKNKALQVKLVDEEKDIWGIIWDDVNKQTHHNLGQFKTLATALGEAVLNITE